MAPLRLFISNLDAARIFPFLNFRLIKIFIAIVTSFPQIKMPSHLIEQLGYYVKTVCISPTFPQDGFCLSLELSEKIYLDLLIQISHLISFFVTELIS
jgi:hypothetical protein